MGFALPRLKCSLLVCAPPRSGSTLLGGEAPDYSSLDGVHDYREHLRAALERGTTSTGLRPAGRAAQRK